MRLVLDHWLLMEWADTEREEEDIGLQWVVGIAWFLTMRLLSVDPLDACLQVDIFCFRECRILHSKDPSNWRAWLLGLQ